MITVHYECKYDNSFKVYILNDIGRIKYSQYIDYVLENRKTGILERKIGMFQYEVYDIVLDQHCNYPNSYELLTYDLIP